MKVSKSSGTGGPWLKKQDLKNGDQIKLVSEAGEIQGQNGIQLVAKCRIKGWQGDAMNLSINPQSKNALIDAFGDDTKNWINQLLTAHVERALIGGKRVTILYLIPQQFEITEDQGGYIVIKRVGDKEIIPDSSQMAPDDNDPNGVEPANPEEINPEDIPF